MNIVKIENSSFVNHLRSMTFLRDGKLRSAYDLCILIGGVRGGSSSRPRNGNICHAYSLRDNITKRKRLSIVLLGAVKDPEKSRAW